MDRRTLYAALIALLGLLIVIGALSGAISATEQVTNESASTLAVGSDKIDLLGAGLIVLPQGLMFAFFLIFTFGSLGAIGGGLVFIFRFLNYQVTASAEEENEPMNPLSYDAYGHAAGIGLVVALAALLMGIIFKFDVFKISASVGIAPKPASVEGLVANDALVFEAVVISLIFGLVTGLFVHFLIYYRMREGEEDLDGKFIHGNNRLEIAWTVIPLVFLMIVAVVAAIMHQNQTEAKDGEIALGVTGQQWSWSFTYPVEVIPEDIRPDGVVSFSSPDLVFMIDQPYVMNMTSVDVIHSFWIPDMYMKRDVVPGIQTEIRLTPNTETGYPFDMTAEEIADFPSYKVQCAELCGTNHSLMLADVYVLSEADYRHWLEVNVLPAFGNPVLAGANLYEQKCVACHSLDGSDGVAPTWLNLYGSERSLDTGTQIADQNYLHASIVNPNSQIVNGFNQGIMPQTFGSDLSETEIQQIIYFIMSNSEQGCAELPGLLPDADVESPAELCSLNTANATE